MRKIKIVAVVMLTLPFFFSRKKDKDTAPAFYTIDYIDKNRSLGKHRIYRAWTSSGDKMNGKII